MASKMNVLAACTLLLALLAILIASCDCERHLYPGLRRKANPQYDVVSADYLTQLLEENARRRLEQRFAQQLELVNAQLSRQRHLLEEERLRQRERQEMLRRITENEPDADADLGNTLYGDANEKLYVANSISKPQLNKNNNNNNNDNYDYSYESANSNAGDDNGDDVDVVDAEDDENKLYEYNGVAYNSARNSLSKSNVLKQSKSFERPPFAVGPSDYRFYEPNEKETDEVDFRPEDYVEYQPPAQTSTTPVAPLLAATIAAAAPTKQPAQPAVLVPVPGPLPRPIDELNLHRIKSPNGVITPLLGAASPLVPSRFGPVNEISALIEKLQKESGVPLGMLDQQDLIVRRHPLNRDAELSLYLVALVGAVSAIVTIGLVILTITWYQHRHKSAADVDYPAYGVIGPSKDISPSSGDRKLAQSAHMYHYQHQKQQIIAMEGRQSDETRNCCTSDVESDDENVEGDYTVYECPGLASTGEMEVKNPLFLDETPATPGNGSNANKNAITQATLQQPPSVKSNSIASSKKTRSDAVAVANVRANDAK